MKKPFPFPNSEKNRTRKDNVRVGETIDVGWDLTERDGDMAVDVGMLWTVLCL